MNVREWALPVYTILMQLAVGSLGALWTIRAVYLRKYGKEELERLTLNPIAIILLTVVAAMLGSFFHLSQPYKAFLAILNILNSWLSREIVFTVCMFGCIVILWYLQANVDGHTRLKTWLGWAGFAFGLGAVFCMSRIYILPTQASWDTPYTTLSFYTSVIVLGAAACLTMVVVDLQYSQIQTPNMVGERPAIIRKSMAALTGMTFVGVVLILGLYIYLVNRLNGGDVTAEASLQLYLGLYQPLLIFRLVAMLAGAAWMVFSVYRTLSGRITLNHFGAHTYLACLFLLVGEILGRFLFYATHIRLGI